MIYLFQKIIKYLYSISCNDLMYVLVVLIFRAKAYFVIYSRERFLNQLIFAKRLLVAWKYTCNNLVLQVRRRNVLDVSLFCFQLMDNYSEIILSNDKQ